MEVERSRDPGGLRVPGTVLLVALLVWVVLAAAALACHRAGRTGFFDLGYEYNVAWNAVHREPTRLSFPDYGSRRYIHLPILGFAVAQLLRLHDSPETLLVVQALALALSVPLCFLLGERILGPPRGGWLLVGVFLATPSVFYWNQWDYHPVVLAVPILLSGCLGLLVGSTPLALAGFGMALAVREDVSMTVAWVGLLVALSWPARRRVGWVIAVAGLGWFLAVNGFVIPALAGANHHPQWGNRYGHLGQGPGAILATLLLRPHVAVVASFSFSKLAHAVLFLVPTLGIPLLAPEVLAGGLAFLGYAYLCNDKHMLNVRYHYGAVFVPFLLVAFAVGFRRLEAWLARGTEGADGTAAGAGRSGVRRPRLATAVLVASVGSWLVLHTWMPAKPDMFRPRAFVPHLETIRELVPPEAALWVQGSLAPHFMGRPTVSLYDRPDPEVGSFPWIVLSLRETDWPPFWMPWNRDPAPVGPPEIDVEALVSAGWVEEYGIEFAADGVVVLRRDESGRLHPDVPARLRAMALPPAPGVPGM